MEKIINRLINDAVKGVDTYKNSGSTWLIFTENKQWVIELTESKTLWYNYNFFKELFSLTSMDVVDNQHYITKWVEDNLINVPKCTEPVEHTRNAMTKDTIKYGIKDTILEKNITEGEVDDIIQDGVKKTTPSGYLGSIEMNGKIVHQIESPKQNNEVEDTIQNGVKDTHFNFQSGLIQVEDVIQNGVRQTNKRLQKPFRSIKDAIQNGVKDTKKSHWIKSIEAEDIIENGICDVKHSYDFEEIVVKDIIEDSYPHKHRVEGVIKNTVKDGI
jgi:hypothetical protein